MQLVGGAGDPRPCRCHPDDLTLFEACTSYGLSVDPPPEPEAVTHIADPRLRTRTALHLQYAYFRRNETLLANVTRDTQFMHERLQAGGVDWSALPEGIRLFNSQPARLQAALADGWDASDAHRPQLLASLGLALDFATWRTLTDTQGLDDGQAVALMDQVVCSAAQSPPAC